MLNNYYTVNREGSDSQIIQKSNFIGYVKRVESEAEALEFIQEIKKKHADATHNCSAYIIGEHDQHQKANDDGEPTGTAGVPILEVIKKKKLKDTAVVVTRYFGGIKLGGGGLIRAYGSTATLAINTTGVVERKLMQGFSVEADYGLLGKIEHTLRGSEYILKSIDYLEKVSFQVFAPMAETDTFLSWIKDMTNDQVSVRKTKTEYLELPVNG